MSGRLHVPVFGYSPIKIVTQGQLCQQLVRPLVHTCFRFSAHKNRSIGAAMLAAGLNVRAAAVSDRLYVPVFAFPLVKIVTRG